MLYKHRPIDKGILKLGGSDVTKSLYVDNDSLLLFKSFTL